MKFCELPESIQLVAAETLRVMIIGNNITKAKESACAIKAAFESLFSDELNVACDNEVEINCKESGLQSKSRVMQAADAAVAIIEVHFRDVLEKDLRQYVELQRASLETALASTIK